jgi:hypothetical protein
MDGLMGLRLEVGRPTEVFSLHSIHKASRRQGRVLVYVVGLATLAVLGVLGYASYYATKTIADLLGENKELRAGIENLTHEDQIGYAKVLKQETRDGKLCTRLLFVETDRADKSQRLLEKEFEIEGDIVHFDALIVKFGSQLVRDGQERAMYLWRRVYGESMAPQDGYPIADEGKEPARYADLCAKLSIKERDLFWTEIWRLANDPARLRELGVTAIDGKVTYKSLRPGFIYVFKIGAQGDLFSETVPDL